MQFQFSQPKLNVDFNIDSMRTYVRKVFEIIFLFLNNFYTFFKMPSGGFLKFFYEVFTSIALVSSAGIFLVLKGSDKCFNQGLLTLYMRKISGKTNISYPLTRTRTCAYQKVRMVIFWKILRTHEMNDPSTEGKIELSSSASLLVGVDVFPYLEQ